MEIIEEHSGKNKRIREVMENTGKHIAILLDTKGPEIRTGKIGKWSGCMTGNKIMVTTDYSFIGNKDKIAISYPGLVNDLKLKYYFVRRWIDRSRSWINQWKWITCLIRRQETKGLIYGSSSRTSSLSEKDR